MIGIPVLRPCAAPVPFTASACTYAGCAFTAGGLKFHNCPQGLNNLRRSKHCPLQSVHGVINLDLCETGLSVVNRSTVRDSDQQHAKKTSLSRASSAGSPS